MISPTGGKPRVSHPTGAAPQCEELVAFTGVARMRPAASRRICLYPKTKVWVYTPKVGVWRGRARGRAGAAAGGAVLGRENGCSSTSMLARDQPPANQPRTSASIAGSAFVPKPSGRPPATPREAVLE